MNAIKREVMEGIRTYKFLVLAIGIVLYAVLDPVMLKILPKILENQTPGLDISQLMAFDQKAAVQNYMKSLSQIGILAAAFTFMKSTSEELKNGTLVQPVISGLKPSVWIGAKILVYGIALLILATAGIAVNAAYAGSLFGSGGFDYIAVIKSGLWFGLYFVMLLCVEIFTGCLTKSPAVTAVAGLAVAWLLPPFTGLLGIQNYTPVMLLNDANALSANFQAELMPALLITLAFLSALFAASVFFVKNTDLAGRR